ncbi:MAG: DUF481 domain-containing protein [Endozoicomonas sp. (ex Botrylloides leachii)]|nr:DUF481 domain-containing protein [Endozoicomonas sp. (ex Botrylloides leachii)]
MNCLRIYAFVLAIIYCLSGRADTVILDNGDQLTAVISSIKHDTAHINSPILGKLSIPMSHIHSIQFQGSYWIKLKGQNEFKFIAFGNKTPIFYKINSSEEKNLSTIAELSRSKPVEKSAEKSPMLASSGIIKSVNKTVITADDLSKVPKDTWLFSNQLSGYIDLQSVGNPSSKQVVVSASGEHQLRNTHNRNTINWEVKNSKQSGNTSEKYIFNYAYNYFYTKKSYLTANTSLNHDDDATPFRFYTTALGFGYQFYDTDQLSLSLETGAGYSIANYRSYPNISSPSFYSKVSYNQKITNKLSLFDDTQLNGLIDDNSINIDGKAGLKYLLKENLWLELANSYTWTNKPDDGFEDYNGDIKAGIGFNW